MPLWWPLNLLTVLTISSLLQVEILMVDIAHRKSCKIDDDSSDGVWIGYSSPEAQTVPGTRASGVFYELQLPQDPMILGIVVPGGHTAVGRQDLILLVKVQCKLFVHDCDLFVVQSFETLKDLCS